MKKFLLAALYYIAFSGTTFAGSGIGGGGLGKQLQEVAMSETMLSAIEMREVIRSADIRPETETLRMSRRTAIGMESGIDQPAGVLIEVKASDFSAIAADALTGKDFIYRDITVRVTESDTENEIVTMSPIEDSSVTIVVKAVEGSSL